MSSHDLTPSSFAIDADDSSSDSEAVPSYSSPSPAPPHGASANQKGKGRATASPLGGLQGKIGSGSGGSGVEGANGTERGRESMGATGGGVNHLDTLDESLTRTIVSFRPE